MTSGKRTVERRRKKQQDFMCQKPHCGDAFLSQKKGEVLETKNKKAQDPGQYTHASVSIRKK